jgi:hypothetical protein
MSKKGVRQRIGLDEPEVPASAHLAIEDAAPQTTAPMALDDIGALAKDPPGEVNKGKFAKLQAKKKAIDAERRTRGGQKAAKPTKKVMKKAPKKKKPKAGKVDFETYMKRVHSKTWREERTLQVKCGKTPEKAKELAGVKTREVMAKLRKAIADGTTALPAYVLPYGRPLAAA